MIKLSENTIFADRYQFKRLLGRGGFSEVWLAVDKMTNLEIAVKVYAPGQGMDTDGMKDFCKELSQVYNLNHTNLVKPQHVDNWEGMPYLVMTYCPQGSCHRMIGKMTEEQIWKMLHDVASGLAYLHEQGIIHQDIKPDNILLDPLGNYVITDFGISIQSRSTLRKSMNIATGSGTTAYMGPERFSKDPTPIKASDIWSLGATAYELLTGNAPFGEIGGGLQKGGADIPTIKQNISPALRQTLALMLTEEPWKRPTASKLAEWADNPDKIEESFLKVSPRSFEMNSIGGEQLVSITSQEPWEFTYDKNCTWIKVAKQGDDTLKIAYFKNESGQERSSVINIDAGNRSASISFIQKSIPPQSKKFLYVAGVLLLIIGIAMYHHYFIQIPKKINDKAEKCSLFISNLKASDPPEKLTGPVFSITGIDSLENKLLFKNEGNVQSKILIKTYIDSLQSIRPQLEQKIDSEVISAKEEGLETTFFLEKYQAKKKIVDNIIFEYEQGCKIKEIRQSLRHSKNEK